MASRSSGRDLRHLGNLLELGPVAGMTDVQLIDRFTSTRGEPAELAFAALMARHGPMVLGVCRRILRDEQAAEDAFQATFLVFVRRAGTFEVHDSLGRWLHGVSRRIAARARTTHRRPPPPRPPIPLATPPDAAEVAELRGVLDEEVARLPGRLRESVVLCLLEGLTLNEAASRMGCAPGTAGSRLSRARDLLRTRLARRGYSPAVIALAAPGGPAGLPSSLIRATTALALGGRAAAAPASVGLLVRSTLKEMMMTRVYASVLLVAGGLLAGGAVLGAVLPAQIAFPDPPGPAASVPPPPPAAAGTMRVLALGPQGEPVPGAHITASIWTEEKGFKPTREYQTDAEGTARVELPTTYTIVRLWAIKAPFVELFAGWEQAEVVSGRGVPADYTFHLENATTAGGRVVAEGGAPIAGARVRVSLDREGTNKPAQGDGRVGFNTWLAEGDDAATTDAAGRWRIANVPNHPGVKLSLFVSHPDFLSDDHWQGTQRAEGVTTDQLRQGTATLTLKGGVIVAGQVTDPTGQPVREGLIIRGDDPYFSSAKCDFPIGVDGRYRLPALPPRETALTVIVPGFAPQMRRVQLQAGMPPQNWRLGPGQPIRLRIVDPAGQPMPHAEVQVVEWMGKKALHNHDHPNVRNTKIPRNADKDGIWEWPWAPTAAVKLLVYWKGCAPVPFEIGGGESPRTVVLKPEHRVTGRVTDAATGHLIPSFTVIPVDVFRKDFLHAERNNAAMGKDGRLDFLATRTDIALRLRVEAAGYRTQDGPEFRVGDDAGRTQDFRLQPAEPIGGAVVDPAGRPVANAEVLLATPTQKAEVMSDKGAIQRGSALENLAATTDAAGRFAFADPGEPWAVVARSGAGYALAEPPDGSSSAGTLRLQPWAAVRGQFRDGGRAIPNVRVFLSPIRIDSLAAPRIDATLQTLTDADGRFEFAQAPPVPTQVRVHLGPWEDVAYRSGPSVPLDLQPGQRVAIDLGSRGATVRGKIALTGQVPGDLDCTYSINHLVRRERGMTVPALTGLGFDASGGWRDVWAKSSEGLAYLGTLRNWFVKLAADGSFQISGVPPGDYDLAVAIYAKPDGCLVDPLARSLTHLTVTAADAASGNLTLPPIAAEVAPAPAVGAIPKLSFQKPDGSAGSLAGSRGRYVLAHFWASWCGPCKQQMTALRRVHDRFAARGLITLGLSIDDDPAAWESALLGLDLPWPQGRLAAGPDVGVSTVPTYWLLDPAGKIIVRANDLDDVAALLAGTLR